MGRKAHSFYTGQKIGKWTVISKAPNNNHLQSTYNCVCSCGTKRVVASYQLKNGHSTNCGCERIERIRAAALKQAHMHTYNGRTLTLKEWAAELRLPHTTLYARIQKYGIKYAIEEGGAKRHKYNGQSLTARQWAATTGIPLDTLNRRLYTGWTIEEAVTLKRYQRRT